MPYDSYRTHGCPQSLLVDDDAAVRAVMTQGLERKGFDVVGADSVTEALRRITTESFDVLISDLHMPDPGDGFTVVPRAAALRGSPPELPVPCPRRKGVVLSMIKLELESCFQLPFHDHGQGKRVESAPGTEQDRAQGLLDLFPLG